MEQGDDPNALICALLAPEWPHRQRDLVAEPHIPQASFNIQVRVPLLDRHVHVLIGFNDWLSPNGLPQAARIGKGFENSSPTRT
jgi:hypothetical protein